MVTSSDNLDAYLIADTRNANSKWWNGEVKFFTVITKQLVTSSDSLNDTVTATCWNKFISNSVLCSNSDKVGNILCHNNLATFTSWEQVTGFIFGNSIMY